MVLCTVSLLCDFSPINFIYLCFRFQYLSKLEKQPWVVSHTQLQYHSNNLNFRSYPFTYQILSDINQISVVLILFNWDFFFIDKITSQNGVTSYPPCMSARTHKCSTLEPWGTYNTFQGKVLIYRCPAHPCTNECPAGSHLISIPRSCVLLCARVNYGPWLAYQ